uniref:Aldehyde dehydrogenase n=1 Tax=Heterorhabditis bacteriophora TaxID=37862 RepID=A0A1I7XP66_HETBA
MNYHQVVENQRQLFRTGHTATVEHRKAKLATLRRLITENTAELCNAVYKDLRRNPKTTEVLEIGNALVEIDYMLSNLSEWSKPIDHIVDMEFFPLANTLYKANNYRTHKAYQVYNFIF